MLQSSFDVVKVLTEGLRNELNIQQSYPSFPLSRFIFHLGKHFPFQYLFIRKGNWRKGIFIYRTLNLGVEFRNIINTSVGRLRKRDGYETRYEKNWNSEENEVFRTHRTK